MARYEARCHWTGSTGLGYENYGRSHAVSAPPAEARLAVTTGEYKGDPRLLNPEQLVVMAASSCQLLWFLHLAAKARVDVLEYEDHCEAEMPEDADPVRITRIALRPRIVIASDTPEERVARLCDQAHERCYVANSLTAEVSVEPRVERTAA